MKLPPVLIIGLLIFIVIVIFSFINIGDPYEMQISQRLNPAGNEFPLGTDEFGRDLLSRLAKGGRTSLGVGISVAFLSIAFGSIIGLYSAYSPLLDFFLMRISDALSAIPGTLLAIALMSAFGSSAKNVIIALTIVYLPGTARLVRAKALPLINEPFVENLRIMGASVPRILFFHLVPNIMSILLVQASYLFSQAVISEASLSFLGAGINEPEPSWGGMIQSGKQFLQLAPHMFVYPALLLFLSVLSLTLISNGLSQFLGLTPENKLLRRRSK